MLEGATAGGRLGKAARAGGHPEEAWAKKPTDPKRAWDVGGARAGARWDAPEVIFAQLLSGPFRRQGGGVGWGEGC